MKPTRDAVDGILSLFDSLPQEEKIALLNILYRKLSQHSPLSKTELLEKTIGEKDAVLPFGIFSQPILSCLEAMVKYLKEARGMRFSAIATLLNRSQKTIWTTYSHAAKKMPEPFSQMNDDLVMPASLIADRKLTVLEHIVSFAKSRGLRNHDVALLLHMDDRTIWTVYDKVKKKSA